MSRVEDLYARFESRFRGTRDQIVERLQVYVPLLEIFESRADASVAIDCGCGRGEWLQVLSERGWTARGIDTSQPMLDEAAARGLTTIHGDAIAYLRSLPDESAQLVSAFHLVEHLPSELLLSMLTEMSRVVAKDGVVLLETPNPENLRVGTSTFYLDPTHDKPLPPQLLQFYAEQSGIRHAHVLRLNGVSDFGVEASLEAAMRPLFEGALDYAIVGTRSEDEALCRAMLEYVEATTEHMPSSLDGVRGFDAAWRVAIDDRALAMQRAEQLARETTDTLHTAIVAVHNGVAPLAPQLRELNELVTRLTEEGRSIGRERSQAQAPDVAVALETTLENQAALHSAIGAVHNGVLQVAGKLQTLRSEAEQLAQRVVIRLDAVDQAIERVIRTQQDAADAGERLSEHVAESHASALSRSEDLHAKWAADIVDSLHHAVERAGRLQAEMLEQRVGVRLDAVDQAFDRIARAQHDVAVAEERVRRQLTEANHVAVAEVVEQFHRSTSWRVTAPLRALSRIIRRDPPIDRRPSPSATPAVQAAGAATPVESPEVASDGDLRNPLPPKASSLYRRIVRARRDAKADR